MIKHQPPKAINPEKLKVIARGLGSFTKDELYAACGNTDKQGFDTSFRILVWSDRIRKDRKNKTRYRFKDPIRRVKETVMNAIHIVGQKGSFAVRDIVVRTDADDSYTHVLIKDLVKKGYLEDLKATAKASGKKWRTPGGLYRLRDSDRFYVDIILHKVEVKIPNARYSKQ